MVRQKERVVVESVRKRKKDGFYYNNATGGVFI